MILAQLSWLLFEFVPWLAWNMAIAYGLSYLGGMLFGSGPKEAEEEPRGQSFAWRPRTTHQEGIPHPMSYGRNMHYGNVVARWTDVDAFGDEILYLILDYGRGPIQGVEVGGVISDKNLCLDGTPTFNILHNEEIQQWYQTAANINDDDKTTYVGFLGGSGTTSRGRYEAIVEFDSSTVDRIEYRRWWWIKGIAHHTGYEKTYLYYDGSYHLVTTKNFTTQGQSTDIIVIEAGGPWLGVTKIKIEVEIYATKKWHGEAGDNKAGHKLYEISAWLLRDTESPVFLNGQPSRNFKQVHIQGRLGTLNQTCMKDFEQNKLEYGSAISIAYGEPVEWASPNNFFDDLEYTLAFPKGLCYHDDSGGLSTHSVGVKVEIREQGSEGAWTELLDTSVSGNQEEPLYKAYKVSDQSFNCAHGTQYDLKYSKTTEDKGSRYGDDLQLRSVREVVDVAFTRPGKALLGITALATPRLSGHIDVKWVADGKLVAIYDSGGNYTIGFTRNRAWIDLAIRTQPVISGDGDGVPWNIERFEGLNPSRVDLAKWYEWAQWCDDQVSDGSGDSGGFECRMPCDIICDCQTNVWSIAYEIARVGRMSPYWRGVVLTGWIDKIVTTPIDLVTFDNIMLRSWKSSWAGYGEMAGSAEIFYKDSLQGYERKSLPIPNEDAGLYTRIVALEAVGVTGTALATRVGNHVMQRTKLIKNINSVKMYKDAFRYKLGEVVKLQATVPNWGQTFRVIKSEANNTVELDRIVENVAENNIIFVRSYDTVNEKVAVKSYTVLSTAGKVVTIKETWDAGCTPVKNNIAAIGIVGAIVERRIVKIQVTQQNYFDIEFETYDATLFNSDYIAAELTNPNYAWPITTTELAKPITREEVVSIVAQQMRLTRQLNADIPQIFNCDWAGSGGDTVTWSKRDAAEPILFKWRGETFEIAPSDTTLEFIYWDMDYPNEFRTTATAGTALAADNWLMCTNRAGVACPAIPIQLLHAAILQAETITAAYGQIADATIGTAKIINLAVETLKINNLAVTTPKIADYAVSKELAEYAINQVIVASGAGTIIGGPLSLVVGDGDVKLTVTTIYGTIGDVHDGFWAFFREDGNPIEANTSTVWAYNWMCYSKVYRYAPGPGTYEYTVKGFSDDGNTNVIHRFFTVQEVKK